MNKCNLKIGQTLLVELDGECVVGELTHVSSARNFIRLCNVRDVSTNKCSGNQDYYSSEVRNICILNEEAYSIYPEGTNSVSSTILSRTTPGMESNNRTWNNKLLFDKTLNAAIEKIEGCVFIHQMDVKYHNVLKFLKKQRKLGIAMESLEEGRHVKSPSLLSVCTDSKIFVFDIKWFKITKDIEDLLRSDYHRRIIHNGRLMRDALQHLFGITLGKCFDTMIAHTTITKTITNCNDVSVALSETSIQGCVEKYLKLPEMFFEKAVDFDERPLQRMYIQEAAKKVAFLLPLEDYFVHEIMLQPFYESCELYANSLVQNSDLIDSLAVMRVNQREEAIRTVCPFSLNINIEP